MKPVNTVGDSPSIYPFSQEIEKKYKQFADISHFEKAFYEFKGPETIKRFNDLMEKSEFKYFFKGLSYEYGINNTEKNYKIAFDYYKKGADLYLDSLSMYRLYFIYYKDFNKFDLKRDRILENFYLFKCFAFCPYNVYDRFNSLANRYDICLQVAIHMDAEDEKLEKFKKLIEYLLKNYNNLNIALSDIIIIKSLVLYRFTDDPIEKIKCLKELHDLGKTGVLEAMYKYAFIQLDTEKEKSEEFIKKLIEQKYYRAYLDIGNYFFTKKKDPKKALEFIELAYKNGNPRAYFDYNDVLLSSTNFSDIFNLTGPSHIDAPNLLPINSKNYKQYIIILLENIINDICIDGYYSYFELFFLRKLCTKHCGLKDLFIPYNKYFKEFAYFLFEITKEENSEKISNNFVSHICHAEFHLARGAMQYYGIEGVVPQNYKESYQQFKIAFKSGKNISYKRFAYYFRTKAKEKLYKCGLVSKEKVDKSKVKLFNLFKDSLKDDSISNFSSSFMYFLARMYQKGYGKVKDNLMIYVCLKRANEACMEIPGTGSLISYYRKYKSILCMKQKEMVDFKNQLNKITPQDDREGYGEDNSLCAICFVNVRNHLILPCRHKFCGTCIQKLKETGRCALCRGMIFDTLEISHLKK